MEIIFLVSFMSDSTQIYIFMDFKQSLAPFWIDFEWIIQDLPPAGNSTLSPSTRDNMDEVVAKARRRIYSKADVWARAMVRHGWIQDPWVKVVP